MITKLWKFYFFENTISILELFVIELQTSNFLKFYILRKLRLFYKYFWLLYLQCLMIIIFFRKISPSLHLKATSLTLNPLYFSLFWLSIGAISGQQRSVGQTGQYFIATDFFDAHPEKTILDFSARFARTFPPFRIEHFSSCRLERELA